MHLLPKVRSWIRRLVLGAAFLAALYLIAANLFLLPSVGPSLISRRPERFRLGWRTAWSLWPGEVRFTGLEIRGRQPRVRWWITAEQGTARIDLAALLRREVRIDGLHAWGVRSQTDRVAPPPGPPPAPPPSSAREPWTVRLAHVELDGVRELGYGPLLLQGDGRIAGSLRIVLRREVALGATVLTMPAGRLRVRGSELARKVEVRAELRLGPYAPRQHRGTAGFDFLTGRLRAEGEVPELGILERIGPAGPGRLAVDLRLERGSLVPGSRLFFAAPGGTRLAASAMVEEGRLVLAANGTDLTLRRRDGAPFLAAAEARLAASSPELRLSHLISDVRTLRRQPFLGDLEASGLSLVTSSSTVTAGRGHGWIDLAALLSRRVVLQDLQVDEVAVRVESTERPPAPAADQGTPWSLEIANARIDRLRELRSGPVRLAGAGRLAGSLSWNGAELEVRDAVLDLRSGRVWQGAEELARGIDAHLAGGLAPCALRRDPGPAALACATVALRAAAQVHRLRALPLAGGSLRTELRIERGRLAPGSFLELGAGTESPVIATVEGGETPRLAAEVRNLALGGGMGRPPVVRAAAARASVPVEDLDLGRLLTAFRRQGLPPVADLEVSGLRMDASGERIAWRAALDRASGRIDLQALARREAVLSDVRGTGARIEVRKSEPGKRPAAPPGAQPWSVRIIDGRVAGVREAAFGPNRLLGNGQMEGSLEASFGGAAPSCRLDRLALSFASARIESSRKAVAQGVSVLSDLRISPFTPGELRGTRLFRLISGSFAVDGDVSSLGFLRSYFPKALVLVDGRGHLSADVHLDAGRLLPGTRLTVDPADAEAEYLLSRARGSARVQGMVVSGPGEPHLVLAVDFGRFQIAARDRTDAQPHVTGEGLELSLTSSDLDLAAPGKSGLVRIVLPDAEVRDLAFYNGYLPPGTGVSILDGTGRLSFDLSIETASRTAHGELILRSQAVRVRVEDLELAGALNLRTRLTSADLRTRRFGLDGTNLSLDGVTLRHVGPDAGSPHGPRSETSWWARVDLDRGAMEWTRPLALQSAVRLEMKEAGFLLSLLSRKRPYLEWFGNRLRRTPVVARG
ncbi:MAG TPA: hypothetical protein VEW48_23270, partial [Thermoanaerobaculia bacterium]|nr:hypothetical protein [Thermoanaerobaculia bacterium]